MFVCLAVPSVLFFAKVVSLAVFFLFCWTGNSVHIPSSFLSISLIFGSVVGCMATLISLVRPYLPLLMTFAVISPSMSNSAIMSLILRCVSGLRLQVWHTFVYMS